ncbi:hypothetical protein C0J52_19573 [Blattella germanica]|nr:hypothetical protein C0J52_19573 [Blattella germanica]
MSSEWSTNPSLSKCSGGAATLRPLDFPRRSGFYAPDSCSHPLPSDITKGYIAQRPQRGCGSRFCW